MCLVGGEIGGWKGKKEREREKMVGRSVWLGGVGEGNFGREFSSLAHQNTIPPNWRENKRENCANSFGQKCPRQSHCVRATAHCFLFFVLNFVTTCCDPLFPTLFKKKKKFLTGHGWAFVSDCAAIFFF